MQKTKKPLHINPSSNLKQLTVTELGQVGGGGGRGGGGSIPKQGGTGGDNG